MTMPAAMSLLTTTFTEGATRDRVLGLNGALLSGGFTVGALVGGTLVGLLSWRAAFFINVPVAVAILVVTPLVIAESNGARPGEARPARSADRDAAACWRCSTRIIERELVRGVVGVAPAGRVLGDRAALARSAGAGAHPAAAAR